MTDRPVRVTFHDYAASRLPQFLLVNDRGPAFVRACALSISDWFASLRNAAICGLVKQCPDDALPAIAWERADFDRAPGESTASWRARLVAIWSTIVWLGTDKGVHDALKLLGCEAKVMRASGAVWDPDVETVGIPGLVPLNGPVGENMMPLAPQTVWIIITDIGPVGRQVIPPYPTFADMPVGFTFNDLAAIQESWCGVWLWWYRQVQREANKWLASDVERRTIIMFEDPTSRIGAWPPYATFNDLPNTFGGELYYGRIEE